MTRRGQMLLWRVVACALLVALVPAYAAPLFAGCASTPLVAISSGHSECEHAGATGCAGALACVSVSPALVGHVHCSVTATQLTVVIGAPASLPRDLFQTGPPTPPPNCL